MKPFTLTTLALLLAQATFAQAQSPTQPENKPYLLQTEPPAKSGCFPDFKRAQAVLLNADGSYYGAWQPQLGILTPFADIISSFLSPQAQKISKNWYLGQQIIAPEALPHSGCLKLDAIEKGKIKLSAKLDIYTENGQKVLPESIIVPDLLKGSDIIKQVQNTLAARYPEFRLTQEAAETDRLNRDKAFLQAQGLPEDTTLINWSDKDTIYGAVSQSGNTIGFINQNYQWTLSPTEIQRRGYRDLTAYFWKENLQYYRFNSTEKSQCFGLLDKTGKERLPAQYTDSLRFQMLDNLNHIIATDCNTGVSVLLDLATGKRVYEMPQAYAHLRFNTFPDKQGNAFVTQYGDTTYIGSLNVQTGQLSLPVQFESLTEFDERDEAQAVRAGTNQEGIIGRDGKWTVAPQNNPKFARLRPLPHSDWLEWYNLEESQNGAPTYYYSQRQDKEPPRSGSPFAEQGIDLVYGFDQQGYGLARKIDPDPVKMLQQEGFVNPQGQWLIEPKYTFSDCYPEEGLNHCFERKKADNRQRSRAGLNDAQLTDIGTLASDYFNANNLIIAQQNGKYGVLNRQGKAVVPFAYDKIDMPDKQRFIVAQKAGVTYVYDMQGKLLHELSGSAFKRASMGDNG
ncbi:WG repeat-containing protein [Neisseriaceae bacterium B1]